MKRLDLDKPSSWHSEYKRIFASYSVQSILHDLRVGSAATAAKYSQLESCENVIDPHIAWLIDCSLDIMQSKYSHVAAYHGCRIAAPEDYWNEGILISDFDRLVALLIRCAPEFEKDIRVAAENCADYGYRSMSECRCCFYLSKREGFANTGGYSHGSEYIRSILQEIDSPILRDLYYSSGVPSLISVRIPVDWLSQAEPGPIDKVIATRPLIAMIQEELNPDHPYAATGGFKIRRSLPPNLIVDIEDLPVVGA